MSASEALWDLTEGVQGLVIGDKSNIRTFLQAELAVTGINLQTPEIQPLGLRRIGTRRQNLLKNTTTESSPATRSLPPHSAASRSADNR